MKQYNYKEIEEKWQKIWEREKTFEVKEDPSKKKFYCLEMFPYPSGMIHMGHVRNYSIGDVIARFKRMKGYNVLHPIGWDALGLPAENAAIKHGLHPEKWTIDNINRMREQLKRLGFSYAWEREINTSSPEYYKWNQWFFIKMFEKGLAYRKNSWVNWCPTCKTVLANEQVISGKCWRCDSEVTQREMEQWFLKITEYAEELLEGHKELKKWPEHVIQMQKNWIGKSEGTIVKFPVVNSSEVLEVFTTRIDTIFGATFLVLSPEHPLSKKLIEDLPNKEELFDWIDKTIKEMRLRRGEELEKEGIFTGKKVLNPFSRKEIPVWIANYVLFEYGTGAIMAVPAHDQRDFEFAKKYNLPIRVVIKPKDKDLESDSLSEAFEEYGILVNSGEFNGLESKKAINLMNEWAERQNIGKRAILYRLRDWGISRQRYWGTPIPIVYCKKCGIVPVPYEQLPVLLPKDVKFTGEEGSPLEKVESFVNTKCPKCNGPARRETDTMDTFFDSSWYNYRYTSPKENTRPLNPEAVKYWMPVDIYIGGVEHAILHLIYARFFSKVIRDMNLTNINEPFPHLLAQGMVTKDGAAMSKSKGNVVYPEEFIEKYGADTLRLFILFAAPPEKDLEWSDKGAEGCFRFLTRVWRLVHECLDLFNQNIGYNEKELSKEALEVLKKTHQTIKKVSEDIEKRYHFNTAISAIMELYNKVSQYKEKLKEDSKGKAILKESIEAIIILLSPFAPHICEELWQITNHKEYLINTKWPEYKPHLIKEEEVTYIVQINGKLRAKLQAPVGLSEKEIRERILSIPSVQNHLKGKSIKKLIYIPNKLVNIVT